MQIGIFGGSFNPIHNAHVKLAETICQQAQLDEVWFLVSPHNPLKQSGDLMDENLRFELVRLALEDYPQLKASDYEFTLPRPSYTWNTLQHLAADYPEHTFHLIIGGDNWVAFPKWRNYREILDNHHVIIYPREDSDICADTLPPGVTLVDTPKINITSTMIRRMLKEGADISAYVCKKVAEVLQGTLKHLQLSD